MTKIALKGPSITHGLAHATFAPGRTAFGSYQEINEAKPCLNTGTSLERRFAQPMFLITVVNPREAGELFPVSVWRPILDGKRHVGTLYENAAATVRFLQGLLTADPKAWREEQTLEVFKTIEPAYGMEFRHLVRTWLCLEDILGYERFNKVRTVFLKERGALEGLVPASTGIGMPQPVRDGRHRRGYRRKA